MRKSHFIRVIVLLLVVTVTASCSRFREIQKSDDWKVKYEAAFDYYDKEDYYRAIMLFEEIMPLIRAMDEGEKAQFYYAYCHFYQKSYLLAAHYFKSFATTYSRSEFAEEAHYMQAYSLYLESPIYNLDQSSTQEAIQAMQNHINRYPNSKYFEQASAIINALRFKLEKKNYYLAKQFLKLGRYHAAVIAIENFTKDYPDSDLIKELEYLKIQAQHDYAEQSIMARQQERYQQMVDFYLEYIEEYPDSEYIRDAEKLYEDGLKELNKLARLN